MPYIANNPKSYLKKSVGNGQCVAFAREAANIPHTSAWKRGELVKGNKTIKYGTAIATFDATGRYGNHTNGTSHVAIYLGQDNNGIQVLDQWMNHRTGPDGKSVTVPQPVHERTIHFRTAPRLENDGRNYYVVE